MTTSLCPVSLYGSQSQASKDRCGRNSAGQTLHEQQLLGAHSPAKPEHLQDADAPSSNGEACRAS